MQEGDETYFNAAEPACQNQMKQRERTSAGRSVNVFVLSELKAAFSLLSTSPAV